MYLLGTGAAAAAYLTGRAARRPSGFRAWRRPSSGSIGPALRTVWFFAILTGVRLLLLRPSRREPSPAIVAALVLVGLVGIGLVLETGNRGGRLVYQHGVGTARSNPCVPGGQCGFLTSSKADTACSGPNRGQLQRLARNFSVAPVSTSLKTTGSST